MKNKENWMPTKYVCKKGRLTASRDKNYCIVGSRLVVNIVANYYERHLPDHAHGKLLDLGCGNVPLFSLYEKYVTDVTCVDWHNSLHENKYLDFTCDLNGDLPFDDGAFDTIILSDVLEHIYNPKKLCGEMARILKADGALIMNVPFYYSLHEMPHDYYRYTEFALKRFIEDARLELVLLEQTGGALEVLGDVLSKAFATRGIIGECVANFISASAMTIRKTGVGKKIYNISKERFPLGYFVVAKKN